MNLGSKENEKKCSQLELFPNITLCKPQMLDWEG